MELASHRGGSLQIEKWLLLSTSAPLNILPQSLYNTINDPFFDKLFALFLAESHRWNEIVICVDVSTAPPVPVLEVPMFTFFAVPQVGVR